MIAGKIARNLARKIDMINDKYQIGRYLFRKIARKIYRRIYIDISKRYVDR